MRFPFGIIRLTQYINSSTHTYVYFIKSNSTCRMEIGWKIIMLLIILVNFGGLREIGGLLN